MSAVALAAAVAAAATVDGAAAVACVPLSAPPEVNLFGGEIVLEGGRVLGRVTSGGYAYTLGRNVLCAYLSASEPAHAAYEVEAMGERYLAVRHLRPLYDPDRHAILA